MSPWPPIPEWLQVPDDLSGVDPKLWPVDSYRNTSGTLMLSGCSVKELVAQFGSPLLALSEDDFRTRARSWADAFGDWKVYYAGKALLTKTVARWVRDEGLNLDVCSGNEMQVGLAGGFPAGRMGLHGNNKTIDELALALSNGIGRIIVDSHDEITRLESVAEQLGQVAPVLIRVTTGVSAHTHDFIATGHEDQKFGFSASSGQALEALVRCHVSPLISLRGVHSHIGSQILDSGGHIAAAGILVRLMREFRDRSGVELEDLDLGGGFGIAYTPADDPVDPRIAFRQLSVAVDEARAAEGIGPLSISIEPGRAIIGPSGVGLYTVGTVKPVTLAGGKQRVYVSVDGGMSDNIRPALYGADYTAILANRTSDAPAMLVRIVGKHCETGDILVRDGFLPADTAPGDIIALAGAGAYTRSMASNYNYTFKEPVVALNHGSARLIVRRETMDDLLGLDIG